MNKKKNMVKDFRGKLNQIYHSGDMCEFGMKHELHTISAIAVGLHFDEAVDYSFKMTDEFKGNRRWIKSLWRDIEGYRNDLGMINFLEAYSRSCGDGMFEGVKEYIELYYTDLAE